MLYSEVNSTVYHTVVINPVKCYTTCTTYLMNCNNDSIITGTGIYKGQPISTKEITNTYIILSWEDLAKCHVTEQRVSQYYYQCVHRSRAFG